MNSTFLNKRWIVFQSLIAVAIVPWLIGAGSSDSEEQRRTEIRELNDADRDRLKRNFNTFQQLTTARKTEIRNLHRAVSKDQQLHTLMDRYCEWLKTLSPWQREELRKQTNPQERLKLVKQFRGAQRKTERGRSFPMMLSSRNWGQRLSSGPRFTSDDAKRVMTVLEENLPPGPPDQRRRLQSLPPLKRSFEIMRMMSRGQGGQPRFNQGFRIPPEVIDQILTVITDKNIKKRMQQTSRDEQGRFLGELIRNSLAAEIAATYKRLKPNEEQLRAFMETLDPREKDQVMNLDAESARRRLTFMYFAKNHADVMPNFLGGNYGRGLGRPRSGSGPGEDRQRPPGPGKFSRDDRPRDGRRGDQDRPPQPRRPGPGNEKKKPF